jgi:hypothetical protein
VAVSKNGIYTAPQWWFDQPLDGMRYHVDKPSKLRSWRLQLKHVSTIRSKYFISLYQSGGKLCIFTSLLSFQQSHNARSWSDFSRSWSSQIH